MNSRHPLARILPALAFSLILLSPGHSEMYRWVDQDGMTVYSQSPPPSGEATNIPQQPSPHPADVEAARQRLQQQLEEAYDEREAKADKAEEDTAQRDTAKRNDEACTAARRNLETLTNLGPRRIATPEGERMHITNEKRQGLMDEASDQIQKFCRDL